MGISMADIELLKTRERIFKALSDKTRLEIIEFLKNGERCVCEIIPSIGKAQSTTSKNLDILFRAGILERRVDGKKTLYSIKHDEIFDLLKGADQINLKDFSAISEVVEALKKSVGEK
jgi:ArsR family transcriptional regulator